MALSNIFKSLGNAAYLRLIIFQILENKNGKMEKRYIKSIDLNREENF